MLATVEMDAVAICTPSGMHPEHGIAVANAGKHVITEKPMSITLEGCDRANIARGNTEELDIGAN